MTKKDPYSDRPWQNIRVKIPKIETPSQQSERVRGRAAKEGAVMESGIEFSAVLLRKENASEALRKISLMVWGLLQKAAEMKWDDEKVQVVVVAQLRNNWEQDADGEWHEMGTEEGKQAWLDKTIKKMM